MNPLKTYDYLTQARQRIFAWTRPLDTDQYSRVFPIGLETLGRTLTHIMICEWAYVRRMQGLEVPPYDQWKVRDENPPPFGELEADWTEQAGQTQMALKEIRVWDQELEYQVHWNERPTIVSVTPADIFTQLVLHGVHHRAQAMNILRQLGIAAEDIDYNTLMYKRRDANS